MRHNGQTDLQSVNPEAAVHARARPAEHPRDDIDSHQHRWDERTENAAEVALLTEHRCNQHHGQSQTAHRVQQRQHQILFIFIVDRKQAVIKRNHRKAKALRDDEYHQIRLLEAEQPRQRPREDHTENRQKGRIQQDNDRHGRTERINPIRKVQLGIPDAGVQCQPDHKCHNRHIGAERIVKAVVRHTQQTSKDGNGDEGEPLYQDIADGIAQPGPQCLLPA